ncbi:coatomer subunit epsilon [Pseudovirgaria hyperparasitica]|uniref:Coatomer subunit epsilon n=1 Tax=Pseudovirgaria hyperparasitica TaxID=470096 RepID=A0A6A6W615_9PEZI|nr:coatomer subunit epsilon [Pseudovirgaria hyperparasitica]KAF2758322.1 coatomer subunit epsilon [Pseudovirgaria hyperparasitica]
MDPYSAEGELVNIHNAFHQGQYQQVVDFDTAALSPSNALPARILKLRAQLALAQYNQVLASTKKDADSAPDIAAIRLLAEYLKNTDAGEDAVAKAQKLTAESGDNLTVQLCAGTILAREGLTEEALAVLGKHDGSLDAVALIVQIHLLQNRSDLALQETQRARKWAQDSLLVNLAESWVGLREGGEKYQQAYYVFEELAQAPASQAVHSLLGQAVSELHLGRTPEAEAAFQQAVEMDGTNADLLANLVVLNTILGKDSADLTGQLRAADPKHQFLADIEAKREAFAAASAKYSPKFEP